MKTPFLGKGWKFPPTFEKQAKSVAMSADEIDIEESLSILLTTRKGERITLPDYGCNLHPVVFRSIDSSTKTYIASLISDAVHQYESRIYLNEVRFDEVDLLEGILRIELDYTIRTTNSRRNLVFPFYINEGTMIP
jgi:uncharacterized protein